MNFKQYLENLISEREARMGEINAQIQASQSADEVRSLGSERTRLEKEVAEARKQLMSFEQNGLNPMATFTQTPQAQRSEVVDHADTVEYREAFMNYVCRNTPIPMELRDATSTTDASAVIPTTMLHEIIREMDSYGNIWAKVRKLNVQGGVEIPVLSLIPTASWIGEDGPSADQKIQANTKISFSYFGIECKIAQTLLANVTTIEAFQSLFVTLATEAIVKAIEVAIIKGSGSGQPLGITVDGRVPNANKITLSAEEFGSWEGWKKKVFGKMKKAYRNGMFLMAQGTFDGYIDGMVDSVGQPIGRVNYGIEGGEVYRFGGKTVETVEDDVIADYESASSGDVVAVFVDLNNYGVNSNMNMNVVKWTDHDNNQVKNKATMIVDGKLIDPNGVLIIKKA